MLLKHFKMKEFECQCGCGANNMQYEFLTMLDTAREISGVPYRLKTPQGAGSAFRCRKHNAEIGGRDDSSHLTGWAVDIAYFDNYTKFRIIYGLIKAGFTRIGIGKNFIHVDCDPSKVEERIWSY